MWPAWVQVLLAVLSMVLRSMLLLLLVLCSMMRMMSLSVLLSLAVVAVAPRQQGTPGLVHRLLVSSVDILVGAMHSPAGPPRPHPHQ